MRYFFVLLGCVSCANNMPSIDGGADGGSACAPIEARAASCTGGPCIDDIVRDCSTLSEIVNDSFESAFGTCLATSAPLGDCLLEGRAGVTPSDAARNFATAFCANCVTITPAACEVNFFDEDSPHTGVAGTLILPLTDPLANEAATRCTDGATCGDDIRSCVEGVMADNGIRSSTATCLATAFLSGEVSGCNTPDAGMEMDAGLDAGSDAGMDSGMDSGMCVDTHEPNETRGNTFRLGTVSDRGGYPKDTEVAALTDDIDVDWYEYEVEDAIGGTIGPRVDYRGPEEICMYWECGGDPGSIDCDEGTASTLDGLEGCCSTSRVKILPDCPGFDDSGTVYVVVEPSGMPMCAGYEFDWGDD